MSARYLNMNLKNSQNKCSYGWNGFSQNIWTNVYSFSPNLAVNSAIITFVESFCIIYISLTRSCHKKSFKKSKDSSQIVK